MSNLKFKIWKTITIKDKPDLSNILISNYAQEMLDKVKFPCKEETINLVRLQVKELGLKKDYPTTKEIYLKAKELGLELCPPQVGPQLRVDYQNQPESEWLLVGMEPIADSEGHPSVFGLGRGDAGLRLFDDWTGPGSGWSSDREFFFSYRKDFDSLTLSDPLKKVVISKTFTLNGTFTEEELKKLLK